MDVNVIIEDNFFEDIDEFILIITGIPRRINHRMNYFYSFDNRTFFQRFRVSKDTALYILERIEATIEYPYDLNNAVAPMNQLLVFLRFCATGSHIACISDFMGVHVSTASRIIVRVARAIATLSNQYIIMPNAEEEINAVQLGFFNIAQFPTVIGALDCTHIRIQSPGGNDAEIFRNRKKYFSVNTQVICDSNLIINNIVARWPGSCHDVTIFNNSRVRHDFENNMYLQSMLLGDNGYNLRSYLFTPLLNPVTPQEQLYNQCHIRTRNVVERVFGVWKRRFPVLAYGCRLKLQTILTLIVATAVLHNICRKTNEGDPPEPEAIDRFLEILNENEVPNIPVNENENLQVAQNLRRNLINNYFGNL